MSRAVDRFLFPVIMATLITGVIASVVVAAPPWSNGNSCGSSTYKICVSRDDNNGVPRATTDGDDSTYVGDNYYNTSETIDNSVSSMQNWYSNIDVFFYTGTGYSGSPFCVDSLQGYLSIAFGWDDNFSSHLRTASDGHC